MMSTMLELLSFFVQGSAKITVKPYKVNGFAHVVRSRVWGMACAQSLVGVMPLDALDGGARVWHRAMAT
jgi:hypothetical protein